VKSIDGARRLLVQSYDASARESQSGPLRTTCHKLKKPDFGARRINILLSFRLIFDAKMPTRGIKGK